MVDEYIRRSDALKGVELFQCGWAEIEAVQTDYIERLPAADVAPVVRCKDCRYSKYAAWCEGYACCRTVGEYHHADFGCTAGKLRTNGVTE